MSFIYQFHLVNKLKKETWFIQPPNDKEEYHQFMEDYVTWELVEKRLVLGKYPNMKSFGNDLRKPLLQYLIWTNHELVNKYRQKVYQLLDDISLLLFGKLGTLQFEKCRKFLEMLHRDEYYLVFGMQFDFSCYRRLYQLEAAQHERSLMKICILLESHFYTSPHMFAHDLLCCARNYQNRARRCFLPNEKIPIGCEYNHATDGIWKLNFNFANGIDVAEWVIQKTLEFHKNVRTFKMSIAIHLPTPMRTILDLLLDVDDFNTQTLTIESIQQMEKFKQFRYWLELVKGDMIDGHFILDLKRKKKINFSTKGSPFIKEKNISFPKPGECILSFPSPTILNESCPIDLDYEENKYTTWIVEAVDKWLAANNMACFCHEDLQRYWIEYSGWTNYTPFYEMVTHPKWNNFLAWYKQNIVTSFELCIRENVSFLLYWKRYPKATKAIVKEEYIQTCNSSLVSILLQDSVLGTHYSKHVRIFIPPFLKWNKGKSQHDNSEEMWRNFRQTNPLSIEDFDLDNNDRTAFLQKYDTFHADPFPLLLFWKAHQEMEFQNILVHFIASMETQECEKVDPKKDIEDIPSFDTLQTLHRHRWTILKIFLSDAKKTRLEDQIEDEFSKRPDWYLTFEKCTSKLLF